MSSSEPLSVRLAAVSLDAADPLPEAEFWRNLLGLQIIWQNDDFVALRGAAVLITVQRVAAHRAPQWPTGEVPKQLHLELAATDLDDGERAAVALGATRAAAQPSPHRWRVLIDPAGHPFCLSNQIPDPQGQPSATSSGVPQVEAPAPRGRRARDPPTDDQARVVGRPGTGHGHDARRRSAIATDDQRQALTPTSPVVGP